MKWVPGLKKGRWVSSTSPWVNVPNHSACTSSRSVTGTRRTTDGLQRLNQLASPSEYAWRLDGEVNLRIHRERMLTAFFAGEGLLCTVPYWRRRMELERTGTVAGA